MRERGMESTAGTVMSVDFPERWVKVHGIARVGDLWQLFSTDADTMGYGNSAPLRKGRHTDCVLGRKGPGVLQL